MFPEFIQDDSGQRTRQKCALIMVINAKIKSGTFKG